MGLNPFLLSKYNMKEYILIEKNGNVKKGVSKNITKDTLYKKCGLKKKDGFEKRTTWNVTINKEKIIIELWSKNDGKAGMENKYEFPPPVDEELYFDTCLLIRVDDNNEIINLSIDTWNKVYDFLFGGFEDLEEDDEEDEDDDEDDYEDDDDDDNEYKKKNKNKLLLKKTKTGYVKDGFVVDDEEDDEVNNINDDKIDEDYNDDNYDNDNDNDDNVSTLVNKKKEYKNRFKNKVDFEKEEIIMNINMCINMEDELKEEEYEYSDE